MVTFCKVGSCKVVLFCPGFAGSGGLIKMGYSGVSVNTKFVNLKPVFVADIGGAAINNLNANVTAVGLFVATKLRLPRPDYCP